MLWLNTLNTPYLKVYGVNGGTVAYFCPGATKKVNAAMMLQFLNCALKLQLKITTLPSNSSFDVGSTVLGYRASTTESTVCHCSHTYGLNRVSVYLYIESFSRTD